MNNTNTMRIGIILTWVDENRIQIASSLWGDSLKLHIALDWLMNFVKTAQRSLILWISVNDRTLQTLIESAEWDIEDILKEIKLN